ncbi:uncharacterized protein LOC112638408 [Camponotus floridanus]|uniref:uncharacterized protein LOC112638408 n=1 Tax=Camponotus floridanus TaxID=104421 RepID=UPI000DC6752C|nr:uncharacterized protein LOC112638408 [Camponotus floridanus]
MDFNSEQTLKEVNVSQFTDTWDLRRDNLWPPKKCMDINCAFGYTTRHFLLPELHPNSTLLGVDSLEKMIDHARAKYKTDERIDFETFDIQTKNLPHNYIAQYDHIFSFPTLHSRNNNIEQSFEASDLAVVTKMEKNKNW